MKKSTIERFKETYGNKIKFPKIDALEEADALDVIDVLRGKLGIPKSSKEDRVLTLWSFSTNEMFLELEEKLEVIKDVNPMPEAFNLRETLLNVNITPKESIYYYFDVLHTAKFEDISKYFHGLYLPGEGNIFMFDDSFEWICCVTDYRNVGIIDVKSFKNKMLLEEEKRKNKMPLFLKLFYYFGLIMIPFEIYDISKSTILLGFIQIKGIAAFINNEIWLLVFIAQLYGIKKRLDWARRLSLYVAIYSVPVVYIAFWRSLGDQNEKYYIWFYDKITLMDKTSGVNYLKLLFYMYPNFIVLLFAAYMIIYFSRKSIWFKNP